MKHKLLVLLLALTASIGISYAGTFNELAVPTAEDLAVAGYDTLNNVVICIKFVDEARVCDDILLAGNYNGWSTDLATITRFAELNGFDGWYVAEMPYQEIYDTYTEYPQGKPIHLKTDGTFDWQNQCGDPDAWTHIAGKWADILWGFEYEANIYYYSPGAYIYEMSYWKQHRNTCQVVPKHDYTVNLYAPDACPDMKPAIIGDFTNWSEAMTMTEMTDNQQRTYYSYTFRDEEGRGFKIREIEAYDWMNQIQYRSSDGSWHDMDNSILGTDTVITLDWSDNTQYRFANCRQLNNCQPYNLHAETEPGLVTLTWEADDNPDYMVVILYHDGGYWNGGWYTGEMRQATFNLSNTEDMEFTWSLQPCVYDPDEQFGQLVYGEAFTVPASPYVPRNLNAVYNNGTLTVTWTPLDESLDYYRYALQIDNPLYNNIAYVYPEKEDSIAVISLTPDYSGEYHVYLVVMREDYSSLGYAETAFTIDPMAEHTITTRVLIQPSSNYDVTNGVTLYRHSNYDSSEAVTATEEGNGWYTYTWTTTEPGIRISMDDYYWSSVVVDRDTCLEFTGNLHLASCDAHIMDYTPYNLQAEPGEGFVTLSWEAQDDAVMYRVEILTEDGDNYSTHTVTSKSTSFDFFISEPQTFRWSVRAYSSYYAPASDVVYGEEFTVQPSPYCPKNLHAEANGDGTYTITWSPLNVDEDVHFEVGVYYQNEWVDGEWDMPDTLYVTGLLPQAGYYWYVINVYDIDWNWIGASYGDFEIEPLEARDITVRLLIHPDSEYDLADAVNYQLYNYETYEWVSYPAVAEGNYWYSCTFNSANIAERFKLANGDSYVHINRDTCLEYTNGYMYTVSCDAVAHDYRILPGSLQAVSLPGRVEFSWSCIDISDYYSVYLSLDSLRYDNVGYAGCNKQTNCTYFVPDNQDSLVVYWFVNSGNLNWNSYVRGPEPIVLHKGDISLSNLQATTEDSITYRMTWHPSKDGYEYEVRMDGYTGGVTHQFVSDTAFQYTFAVNGEYWWYVRPVDAEHQPLTEWFYGDRLSPAGVPDAIVSVNGTVEDHTLHLSWQTNTGRVRVFLDYYDNNGRYFSELDTILAADMLDYEVDKDGRYLFYIWALIENDSEPGQYAAAAASNQMSLNVFSGQTYHVQLNTTEGGSLSTDWSGDYPDGYTLTLSVYELEHYHFVRWSDGVTQSYRRIIVHSDTTLTAIFELNEVYTVTLLATEGGQVALDTWYYGEYYDMTGDSITLLWEEYRYIDVNAVADDGWNFVGWSDGYDWAYRSIYISGDTTVTAIFEPVEADIPSGLIDTNLPDNNRPARKVIIRNQLYIILPDGTRYTATGAKVE